MNQQQEYNLTPVGVVAQDQQNQRLMIKPEFASALLGLSGFSHCQVIWWVHEFTDVHFRQTTQIQPPYDAPLSGVFATRSPIRPNPLGLSVVAIESVDVEAGIVEITGLDAYPGTPVLDLKPYFPSTDRVRTVSVPDWAAGWGDWVKE
ncbi:tRNA (N6-threonylcarbamoyladenosine(37)-N6)-methyltransferase TrmO [Paenibacillus sp. MMS20-IR301]|uniref:tRNA (N6-threonylcarbamoyladenosine(37)-N6)-methyltransferase TrmO n=1 Tax=Paenibacillus sp. MMS20-IR301 TaxID=2895946 RepID=UPI0028E2AAF5|nr:tRNA (N6-threonylcarbamoyladenosine(37)-N6)-methyltransferase TrmO [Paenibacillus sp. MMS20-IR301]WNS41621.1 tRNA (N6-threonylcarbamoyladenosine(37)-N6)-methyltransferase TrmO [Paenibacillus sp. MMS20-IR301]